MCVGGCGDAVEYVETDRRVLYWEGGKREENRSVNLKIGGP